MVEQEHLIDLKNISKEDVYKRQTSPCPAWKAQATRVGSP